MVRTDEPMLANYVATGSVVLTSFQIERAGAQVRIVDADGSVYEGTVVNPETPSPAQAGELAEKRVAMQNQIAPQEAAKAERRAAQDAGVLVGGLTKAEANSASLVPAPLNQALYLGVDVSNAVAVQQAVAGSGFAFQVVGLNRKLNQNVTITGNCINALLPAGGFVASGNLSNQSQTPPVAQAAVQNLPAPPAAQPPTGQMKALRQNNSGNNANIQNAQNAVSPAQLWRVTGQVQLGPDTRFNLEAASAPP
jgi:hypothetical protein